MTAWTARTSSPFGRRLTAMVTPMRPDGALDLNGLQKTVAHLLDNRHDGVVVNGTTGEAPTTTDAEQDEILRATLGVVGDRGRVVTGVGTNDTAHTVHLAQQAAASGAHGLLVVTPYYSRPTQAGLLAHFTAVADATDLPVLLYDIPARTGTPIATDTLLRLADHPRIVGVKDAKGDYWAATQVLAQTDLLWFSGDDLANLAHLTQGATGYIGVTSHIAGDEYAAMLAAVDGGDLETAVEIHRRLVPLASAIMQTSQGAIMVKAALKELGVIDSAAVRLPLVESPPEHLDKLRAALSTLKDPIRP
jgi:4-hydroxy-tetrahydrodipicolinate synthase